jgi:CBS domain-containing protein
MDRPPIPSVRDIMTRAMVTLAPEMPALDAAAVLLRHGISGAPVVDGEGRLLGLLSEYDCLRVVAAAGYEMDFHDRATTVSELMIRECHTASADLDLFGLAHEFVRLRVRRLPVLEGERLIGQVSRRDALRAVCELDREPARSRPRYPDYPEGRSPIRDYPRKP